MAGRDGQWYGVSPMKAMKAGVGEFLTKPFRDQELLDAIQRGPEHTRPSWTMTAAAQPPRGYEQQS